MRPLAGHPENHAGAEAGRNSDEQQRNGDGTLERTTQADLLPRASGAT
jgi:hypothetical protein